MSIPLYRIQHILKISADRIKYVTIDRRTRNIDSICSDDKIFLSLDKKNKNLVDQLIYESIAQIAIGTEKRDRKIAEDIPYDLFAHDGSKEIVWNSQLRFSS